MIDNNCCKDFCPLPFSHLYHFVDGKTYPCPKICTSQFCLGSNSESTDTLFNNEILKKMRREFASGKIPDICNNRCFKCLSSGASCIRNNTYELKNHLISNTQEDGSLDKKFYIIKNMPYSNICNLQCVYCDGFHSFKHGVGNINFSFEDGGFEKKFLENIEGLSECWFQGGESFIASNQSKYLWAIKELEKRKLFNVKITISTNGTILNDESKDMLNLLNNKFNDPHVSFSMDGIKKRFEIIRRGSNWESVLSNIKHVVNNYKNITYYCQSTVSILSILHLKELHSYLVNEEILKNPENLRLYHLNNNYLNIKNVNNLNLIKESFDQYNDFLNNILQKNYNTFFNRKTFKERLDEFCEYIKTSNSSEEDIVKLNSFLKDVNDDELNLEINNLLYER